MSLKQALDQGLASVPGCRTICYVDMASGLVLGSASQTRVRQEQFDRLASAANALLHHPALTQLRARLGGTASTGGGGLDQLAIARPDELIVLARSPAYPEHALCYVCGSDADPAEVDRGVAEHKNKLADLI
ncbi:hypothetical protein OU426_15475 [Frigidibacter sp. RF13]|uniref:hypothetical protein n=1 Tax=Frigidibacter sp. RF13 TaxID=2997340 RepID=UPI00226EC499|nr:hypothetical protein [Frigidibacter sp. RF13]MCY1128264.1 hypothetical protein [Frigidibacter sp. RF13]